MAAHSNSQPGLRAAPPLDPLSEAGQGVGSPEAGTTPPGLPRAGEILAGKYRVERVLGVGGMGVVVAATHLELDERVAIKFLLPIPAPSADLVARFVREARAAIKIRSEHVVRIFDVGRLDTGAPFIVMEYLQGSDLSVLVESDGPLPVVEAVDYLLQACEALASAHGMGIVHRDLKPANLFLTTHADGSPCVKVLDFGISKFIGGDGRDEKPGNGVTTTATIMGTPCFMSPEQLRSTRDVDTRADIWALGTILYALLTGSPPYYAETTADVAAKIIRDAPPSVRNFRGDVPLALEQVIARCLEKDREMRFSNVAALADALAEFGSEQASSTATRIKRLSSGPRAVGLAPTLRSSPAGKGAAGAAVHGAPTRTASAWGDTKPHEPKTRRAWLLAGGAIVAGTALLAAALGWARTAPPTSASISASAPLRQIEGPKQTPPPAAEELPRLAVAVTTTAGSMMPVSNIASVGAAAGPRHVQAHAQPLAAAPVSTAGRPVTAGATGAKNEPLSVAVPAPQPTPKPAGLFDDPQ